MILISLLPEQHQQKSKAPFKHLAAVSLAVTVNALLLAWWGWTAFGVAAEVRSELQILEDQNESLKARVAYHRDLERESAMLASREAALEEITLARIPWTQKVDELVNLINRGGNGEKYLIWFQDLKVIQKVDERRGSYGEFEAAGFSGSDQFDHVANFLDDVERDDFSKIFTKPAPPEGKQEARDEELMPSEVWSFNLALGIKSPNDRLDPDDPRRKAKDNSKKKRKKGGA